MRLPGLFAPRDEAHEVQLAHTLRRVPLFAGLPAHDLVRLWRRLHEVRVPAGSAIFRRGDAGDRFFIVKQGALEVCLSLTPHKVVVSRLGPGDSFGEMALLTGAPRAATILAAEDAVLWALERDEFEALVAGSVPLLRSMNRELCERLRRTNAQVEVLRLGDTSASAISMLTATGALHFGPYRALEQIGAGGTAVVYHAVHPLTGEDVAVKVLPGAWGSAPGARTRLAREARVLRSLDHPNVVRLLDVGSLGDGSVTGTGGTSIQPELLPGVPGGGSYVVMELLPQSLSQVLRESYPAPLPVAQALRIAVGVAEGLDAAHGQGVIHRDVKPENILLREDGTPVLADFGLALARADAAAGQRLTADNVIAGTPDYISPEQVAGLPVDRRADIYSLGVVLYEMLAGHVPFAGRDAYDTFTAHLEKSPPPLPAHVPAVVQDVVEQALQKLPSDRFATAGALAGALRAALASLAAEQQPAAPQELLSWAELPDLLSLVAA
ncbi:MAG: serine/threonine protein kinase [uncultured Chloroflexi bacterium]|uniref:non-specific serine/threonine protein kinase n=1 Tax=uncultured Chloroflexota bacterium TaxID=166587 RepID=A0A6J4IKP9_9CHLR|nr:MAG: serine/threonine protein kinase [uncultured Chloroflexota bacterium]